MQGAVVAKSKDRPGKRSINTGLQNKHYSLDPARGKRAGVGNAPHIFPPFQCSLQFSHSLCPIMSTSVGVCRAHGDGVVSEAPPALIVLEGG